MQKYTLEAKSRLLIGRKVKNLRSSGFTPASVYGKNIPSSNIVVDQSIFEKLFKKAGETSVISLVVDGKSVPVLIHNVQVDPVTGAVLHIEFYQVDLKEKVKTKVAVIVVGESPIVVAKTGVLLTLLSEVEVEALPSDLPEHLEIDISSLTEVDQELKVGAIVMPKNVTLITDVDIDLVKVSPLVSREAEVEAAQEAAVVAEAAVSDANEEKTVADTSEEGQKN